MILPFGTASWNDPFQNIHQVLHQEFSSPAICIIRSFLYQDAASGVLGKDQQDAILEAGVI